MEWWSKLRRNRLALIGLGLLIVLYLGAIFAEFWAPYPALVAQREGSLLPPTAIHWFDQTGQWRGPHVYPTRQGPVDLTTGDRPLSVDYAHPAGIRLLVKGDPYAWPAGLSLISGDRHLFGTVALAPVEIATDDSDLPASLDPPPLARLNLLGTDDQGRDYFSRLLFGSRVSLFIGIVGISISFPIGLLMGGISGYLGGVVDILLMRLAEVLMSIPGLYLLVSLAAVLQVNPLTEVPFSNVERFMIIIIITSLIGWAGLARVIRGQVLSLRERDYVMASRVAGAGSLDILWRHILPQTTTYVMISATLAIPGFIAAESVLSLIGLGIQQPDPSWGNMLALATNASIIVLHPWLVITPTLLVVLSCLGFNLLGDGLRDALDPRD